MNHSGYRTGASNTASVETETKRERAPLTLARDKVRTLRVRTGMKTGDGSSGFPTEGP